MLCPLICGAEEIAHGARLHGATDGPSGDSPSHCPEEGDNCICQGAVQLDDARTIATSFPGFVPLMNRLGAGFAEIG